MGNLIQNMVIKQRKSDDNISLSDSYVQIKHETLVKIIVELIIIIGMGVGVYFTLRFSYIESKLDDNAKAIIDLDKRKVDWEDYDRWQRKNGYINNAIKEPFSILYDTKEKNKGDKIS